MTGLTLRDLRTLHLGPIALDVPAGICAAITGPSGSGKTLLLRAIADLDPHLGTVALNGNGQHQCSGPEWRHLVAFMPAESAWWSHRVGDHFATPNPDVLSALGFDPGCFDWEISRLSSGERQRLALARLLSGQPRFLLLDEPTANLDETNRLRVERVIDNYRKTRNAGVIWVSHDENQQARVGEMIFELRDGKLFPRDK